MTERILMCAPDHFEVAYVINPWMEGNVAPVAGDGRVRATRNTQAVRQWQALARTLGRFARVERVAPQPGVPDMVFTANAGLVLENRVVLSRFRHAERQPEEAHFAAWFERHGFEVVRMPQELPFEGAGDALFDRREALLWMGYGHRTGAACAPLLETVLDVEVQPLRLIDPRFYHLDTCFCPLEGGSLLYYPQAFDTASRAAIEARVPAERRIAIGEDDAMDFACNAVNCGRYIVLNRASEKLTRELQVHGHAVLQTPLSAFLKAGGAAKCLTLRLDEARLGSALAA